MLHKAVRGYRSIERRYKDPANNRMSIPAMLWYYVLKRFYALDGKKVVIQVPFSVQKSSMSPGRIAVIVHCFYLDLLDELLDYIVRIPYAYKLYISTDTAEKQEIITEKLIARKILQFEVRRAPNRGRDIAPKYITFRDVYDGHDYFLHLHGKKSPHLGATDGHQWRKYLLHSLLGSTEIIASIFSILKDPRCGMVFPDPYDSNLPELRWSENYEASVALAEKLGIKISRDFCAEYPAGSMFWGKASVVRPLLDLNLQVEDFPLESGQLDGELNHAIERMIVPVAKMEGLHGLRIITNKWRRPRKTIQVHSEADLSSAIAQCIRNEGA